MSEKDIKTKPKQSPKSKGSPNMPKVAVKSKDAVVNTVKDAKSVMKDTLVKKAVESKLGTEQGYSEPQKADTEASERVESAAYTTADTVYHKGKTFTQNKVKEQIQKVKTRENETPENQEPTPEEPETPDKDPKTAENEPKTDENAPKTKENYNANEQPSGNERAVEQAKSKAQEKATVKTKEEYLKSQSETSSHGVKTKENYIKQHTPEDATKGVKGKEPLKAPSSSSDSAITPKDARKEYVSKKLKTKAEYQKRQAEESGSEALKNDTHSKASELNAPKEKSADVKTDTAVKMDTAEKSSGKSMVKTKESYMQSLRESKPEPIKSPYNNTPKSKQTATSVKRSTANSKKALKTRDNVVGQSKSVVKNGSAYTTKTAKKKATKATKKVVKTQKEVTKKAAKEAAKRARQAAIKAAQVAKAVAIKTAKAVAAIGKAIAAAVTKAAAAFFAAFGWIGVIVVLVILIVIIIVAAIAGSPFGIFISDEAADADSIPVSSIVNECNMELSARLTEIEDNTTHDRIVMEGEQADWSLVLSLFAVKVAGVDDETVQDVVVIDDAKKQKLKDVFWDMHTITKRTETVTSGETSEIVLYITITAKTKDEMISEYGFTRKQKEALETLLENADGFIGATQSLAISDATAQDIIDNLPDSLSAERKNVVKKACSLVGKLTYFWGGKSSAIGWDSEWGKMKLVTAEGSRSTGCMRPFGLDCSGFVTWAFHNAGFSESAIGHGASTQASKGTRISWSSAQPGDLAVYDDKSHIGIIGGRDSSGNILVIHCSSGANNVVITTGGFGFAVSPNCY